MTFEQWLGPIGVSIFVPALLVIFVVAWVAMIISLLPRK